MTEGAANHFIAALDRGDLDEHIELLAACLRDRRRTVARRTAAALRPDDDVELRAGVSPRYLVGKRAKVVKTNKETVTVALPREPGYGRMAGARQRVPNELVRPVTGE